MVIIRKKVRIIISLGVANCLHENFVSPLSFRSQMCHFVVLKTKKNCLAHRHLIIEML